MECWSNMECIGGLWTSPPELKSWELGNSHKEHKNDAEKHRTGFIQKKRRRFGLIRRNSLATRIEARLTFVHQTDT